MKPAAQLQHIFSEAVDRKGWSEPVFPNLSSMEESHKSFFISQETPCMETDTRHKKLIVGVQLSYC
jgi:PAB1-binding protein PBP1